MGIKWNVDTATLLRASGLFVPSVGGSACSYIYMYIFMCSARKLLSPVYCLGSSIRDFKGSLHSVLGIEILVVHFVSADIIDP